jgi:hypothetical protein
MKNKIEENIDLAVLFAALRDKGASHLLITFSGSGDNGDFDDVFAIPNSIVDDEGNITINHWQSDFEEACEHMPNISSDHRDNLIELIDEHTKDYDWWNNDGGSGYIVIDLLKLTFYTDYTINRTEYDSYNKQGKIKINEN